LAVPRKNLCFGVYTYNNTSAITAFLALVHEENTATAGFTVDVEKRKAFSEKDVQELVQLIFPENLYTNCHEIQSRVLDFYLNDDSWPVKSPVFYLQKYTQVKISNLLIQRHRF
jgi:hypothetical protein